MKYLEKYETFIINESFDDIKGAYKPIDVDSAVKIIKKNCKKYNTYRQQIYRGFKSTDQIFSFDSKKIKNRMSANAPNYFTLLIDNFDSWAKFPKRSKSIICTTNMHTAYSYGEPYRIIPFDGTELAVCPDGDMWASFENLNIDNISELSYGIESMIEDKDKSLVAKAATDFKVLKSLLLDMTTDEFLENTMGCYDFWYDNYGDGTDSAFSVLEDKLTPVKFKLTDHINLSGYENNEVYFEGKCLAINEHVFEKVRIQAGLA